MQAILQLSLAHIISIILTFCIIFPSNINYNIPNNKEGIFGDFGRQQAEESEHNFKYFYNEPNLMDLTEQNYQD